MVDAIMEIAGFDVGNHLRPFFIVGPCVIEDEDLVHQVAAELKSIFSRLGVPFLFKASFDKANRTSLHAFRGPGLTSGLRILAEVKARHAVPVISDIHEPAQAEPAAEVLDMLQIPAFLCRQTDLLVAAAKTGRPVNVKKGQFLAPWDMAPVVEKLRASGNARVVLTERGTTFGYNNLVVDMRGLQVMKELGVPVVFDCTHSVQLPGGQGQSSGGQRQYIPTLMRAAAAVGVAGFFMEVHPNPTHAKSDGPNAIPLERVEALVVATLAIDRVAKQSVMPVLTCV